MRGKIEKISGVLIAVCMLMNCVVSVQADIIILFKDDVHCAVAVRYADRMAYIENGVIYISADCMEACG